MGRGTHYDRSIGKMVYSKGHPQAGQIIWRRKDIEGIYGSKYYDAVYGEFIESYRGDPSVGIWGTGDAEKTRDELLKDSPSDRGAIEKAYRKVKNEERKEAHYSNLAYKEWKRDFPEEYQRMIKRNRSFGQTQRWKKTRELASNRGQGGYFRHRREHSRNARKGRRR